MKPLSGMLRRERLGAVVCLGLAAVWTLGRFYDTALAFLTMSLLYFPWGTRISHFVDLVLGVGSLLMIIVYGLQGVYLYAVVYLLVLVACLYKMMHARSRERG